MLQGRWPGDGCEYCHDIETADGMSDRQFQNQIPNVYPAELDRDPTLVTVAPAVLEVFFSNTCNLACVYCNAGLSSSIQAENKKFGGAIFPELDFIYQDNRYKELVPKFWKWFYTNSQNLHRLQILGGEPFLQSEFNDLLEFFDSNPHPNLEFNIVSNLSLPTRVLEPALEKLAALKKQQKLKRIDIQISVDCWGPEQEYIRHGFDMTTFDCNVQRLIELGEFRIGLLSTVTSLSIRAMPALAAKYNHWCKKQKIYWYMHLVLPNKTSVFDPTIFDYSHYAKSLDDVLDLLPNTDWDDLALRDTFNGIVSKLKQQCANDLEKQQRLCCYLDSNDQRKNKNWQTVFAWLNMEELNVV
jgi:organic radical activating enzyme